MIQERSYGGKGGGSHSLKICPISVISNQVQIPAVKIKDDMQGLVSFLKKNHKDEEVAILMYMISRFSSSVFRR